MPHTAQKPAQVRKYCQERRLGGGQIRQAGTATDQTAPANEAMRMATATAKRMLDISGQILHSVAFSRVDPPVWGLEFMKDFPAGARLDLP